MKSYNDNDNNQQEQRPRFRGWWIYLIALLLIGIIIYSIVRQFQRSNVVTYNDTDMIAEVKDTDNDGDLEVVSTKGTLATILYTGEVRYINQETHRSAGYIYLSGSYLVATSSGNTRAQNFAAYLTLDNTEAVESYYTIINTRLVSGSTTTLYYSSANPTGYGALSFTDYSTRTSLSDYLPNIILWIIIIGAGIYMVNRLGKSVGSANNAQFNFNSSRAKKETHSKVRFSDVAGCDEVKAELSELVDYFHNAKKYTRLGAKLPKGILLQGPPGTGKTLLAKAVAGEADVPFYSISGSDFVEMYVGVGAGRVRDMFRIAKQNAPCLIFIDEIDAVGRQRGAGLGGGNDEREQTLNQLLVEMDGFEDNSGVIVMAATNRADVLDPALLRAGRFDRTITVDLPDKEGRAAILKVHARNKIMAPNVDFNAIATRTVGMSGADLANILNDAAILAVRENKNAIDMDDIDEAIDRSIAGPAKSNRSLSPDEKRRVAYHEAGHATIGIHLQHSEKVQRITIIPRGRTGGHVLMTPQQDRFLLTKSELEEEITGLLGGRVAEELIFGDVSTGASNDIEKATQIARSMVVEYGMSDLGPIQYESNSGSVFLGRDYTSSQQRYSAAMALEIDKAIRKIIDSCHKKATEVLTEYRSDLDLIATTLEDKETITAEQIDYLIKYRKLPPKDYKPGDEVKTDTTDSSTKEEKKPEEKAEETSAPKESTPVAPAKETKPSENKEEKPSETAKPNEEVKEFTPDAEKFHADLIAMRGKASLMCLFVEDQKGSEMSTVKMHRMIRKSTDDYISRIQGLEEPVSQKVITAATEFVPEHIWKQFNSTAEDFGQWVEDESGIEVILAKVEPASFLKLYESAQKNKGKLDGTLNTSAHKAARSLKDAVSKEDDEKKK